MFVTIHLEHVNETNILVNCVEMSVKTVLEKNLDSMCTN